MTFTLTFLSFIRLPSPRKHPFRKHLPSSEKKRKFFFDFLSSSLPSYPPTLLSSFLPSSFLPSHSTTPFIATLQLCSLLQAGTFGQGSSVTAPFEMAKGPSGKITFCFLWHCDKSHHQLQILILLLFNLSRPSPLPAQLCYVLLAMGRRVEWGG
ncbi:MAG: hypothetical protein J3Q66DRAFT_118223 [Benniella sp.]|nr:MAG: hypothetical protein J3Q66DRAFT_118223 [Benniella sp.]